MATTRSTSKPSPEQILTAAVTLMEGVVAQLLPVERQRLVTARQYLNAKRPFPQNLVLLLQQDYMRLRSTQMQTLSALEEASPHLFPEELDTVHASRIVSESGRPVSDDLVRRLETIRLRVQLPQIIESLIANSALLSDLENHLVEQANLSMSIGGNLPPVVQQKMLQIQQNVLLRQHLGMFR